MAITSSKLFPFEKKYHCCLINTIGEMEMLKNLQIILQAQLRSCYMVDG